MSLTNQKLFKICLSLAVLAVFSQVGFAQQVLVIPSQSINVSDPSLNQEEEAIEIATQNILSTEKFSVSVSIQLDVVPVLSAPVIKVDNVLYATDGELIYKKEQSRENWVITSPQEQPEEITSAFTQPIETSQPADLTNSNSAGFGITEFELGSDFSVTSQFNHSAKSDLPSDFPFQFSLEVTSVFFHDNSLSRMDVILGSEIQISFTKVGLSWVASDLYFLGSSEPTSVTGPTRAGPYFLFDGFLSGSFSFLRNYSVTPLVRINGLILNPSRLNYVPEINHIASGWTPTVGSVYDRNADFNLIFCSYLQTFSSFYSTDYIFSTISSALQDESSPSGIKYFDTFGLSESLFKGLLT